MAFIVYVRTMAVNARSDVAVKNVPHVVLPCVCETTVDSRLNGPSWEAMLIAGQIPELNVSAVSFPYSQQPAALSTLKQLQSAHNRSTYFLQCTS
jgi:hypothetical protein